jgi:hypothetical protein
MLVSAREQNLRIGSPSAAILAVAGRYSVRPVQPNRKQLKFAGIWRPNKSGVSPISLTVNIRASYGQDVLGFVGKEVRSILLPLPIQHPEFTCRLPNALSA